MQYDCNVWVGDPLCKSSHNLVRLVIRTQGRPKGEKIRALNSSQVNFRIMKKYQIG